MTFTKAGDPRHLPVWVARDGKRVVRGSILGSDPRGLPHDVVQLVVERALGLDDGFWGTVAAGGTVIRPAVTELAGPVGEAMLRAPSPIRWPPPLVTGR